MITREQYEHYKRLVYEYEQAEYDDKQRQADDDVNFMDDDSDDDDVDIECEDCGRLHCVCDLANGCTCGAWVFSPKGLVHVADCICGGGL